MHKSEGNVYYHLHCCSVIVLKVPSSRLLSCINSVSVISQNVFPFSCLSTHTSQTSFFLTVSFQR